MKSVGCTNDLDALYMIDARPILEPYFERAGVTADQITGVSMMLGITTFEAVQRIKPTSYQLLDVLF